MQKQEIVVMSEKINCLKYWILSTVIADTDKDKVKDGEVIQINNQLDGVAPLTAAPLGCNSPPGKIKLIRYDCLNQ